MPIQGRWSAIEAQFPINLLELRAIRLALQHFETVLQGRHVVVQTDNVAAKAHINKQGGFKVHGSSQGGLSVISLGGEASALHPCGTHKGTRQSTGGLVELSGDPSR